MSEQDRSRLYDWWCEHADEALAEYAMSCLSPVPLPDLATKEDFARFETATKEDFTRFETAIREDFARLETATKEDFARLETATKEDFARLDARVDKLDAKVAALDTKVATLDTKVDLLASQHRSDRDEDRRVSRVRHYWLVGVWVSVVVPIWLGAAGVIS